MNAKPCPHCGKRPAMYEQKMADGIAYVVCCPDRLMDYPEWIANIDRACTRSPATVARTLEKAVEEWEALK